MKTFLEFITEDRAQPGEGDIVWHVSGRTRNRNKMFGPMSHFGTQEAAREVGQSRSLYDKPVKTRSAYAVRIKHGRSFETEDIGDHSPQTLLTHLHERGMFSKAEYEKHHRKMHSSPQDKKAKAADNAYLAKAINSKGYDSLHYTNNMEDFGSTSHIITRPDQVRIVKSRGHGRRELMMRDKPSGWSRRAEPFAEEIQ